MSDTERQITEDELKKCDGQEGRPAWVAYRGKVYDVSASQRWPGGMHMKRHQVGKDLTSEFAAAPHDESVFQRLPLVGRLVAAEQKEAPSASGCSTLTCTRIRFPCTSPLP